MKMKLFLVILVMTMVMGCRVLQPTPPGWRSLVSALLVEDNVFPEGWARIRDLPQAGLTDPTINHVYRSWWKQAEGDGKADQAIWRAYTIAAAKEQYADLRRSQFYLLGTLSPDEFFVEFTPPDEIDFQSETADEFYLACGWRIWAHCEVVARYRNYVTNMMLDLEAECKGHVTHGLTYPEIETVVRAMDARFEQFFAGLSTPGP